MPNMQRILTLTTALLLNGQAVASALETIKIKENIYAIVGGLEQRSPSNLGNNATFGFVVTSEGVVLIDAGGTELGAKAIEQEVRSVTDKPIVTVINTGGQDHRWFGNHYFASLGAETITAMATAADHLKRQSMQIEGMKNFTQDGWVGTEPQVAKTLIESETDYQLGDTEFSVIPVGPAHTANENFVWLPKEQVLFSGDVVYVERMLGIMDHSNHKPWLETLARIEALNPSVIIPGHGHPTSLETAKRDTFEYLNFLREEVAAILDDGGDMQSISTIDQSKYEYLISYESLHGANAQRVFEEMEWE
jgi:glyoxylase-like metal-dependent hydrolase (beta-lactamase superfamily II)